jgi:branched-chain amino acid transport system ATP-binding protein
MSVMSEPVGPLLPDVVEGLELRGVTVRFGGHTAVDAVNLDAPVGRLTGLIGPNGAGKTTAFNAICGMESIAHGAVYFDGQDITDLPTHRRARAGIARTFQRLEVFGSLTAAENVQVAAEMRRAWQKDKSDPHYEVETLLERVGAADLANERCDGLPTGQARRVELARALACHPRLLLLDEPASGLTEGETHAFGRLLTELVAEGIGVLLVEHDVALVMDVCEYLYVLDFGAVLAEGATHEIQADEAVRRAYLGTMV